MKHGTMEWVLEHHMTGIPMLFWEPDCPVNSVHDGAFFFLKKENNRSVVLCRRVFSASYRNYSFSCRLTDFIAESMQPKQKRDVWVACARYANEDLATIARNGRLLRGHELLDRITQWGNHNYTLNFDTLEEENLQNSSPLYLRDT